MFEDGGAQSRSNAALAGTVLNSPQALGMNLTRKSFLRWFTLAFTFPCVGWKSTGSKPSFHRREPVQLDPWLREWMGQPRIPVLESAEPAAARADTPCLASSGVPRQKAGAVGFKSKGGNVSKDSVAVLDRLRIFEVHGQAVVLDSDLAAESQPLPRRLLLSSDRRRIQGFDVTDCDIKRAWRTAQIVEGLHRTRRDHGRHNPQQPARGGNECVCRSRLREDSPRAAR